MGGLEGAVRGKDHIEHEGGEAEAVAELLDQHAGADGIEGYGLVQGHPEIDHAGQGQGRRHRPDPFPQAAAADDDPAEDAAEQQADHADRVVDDAVLDRRQGHAAVFHRIQQEGGDEFQRQGLRQAEEQQESHGHPGYGLAEEGGEGLAEFLEDAPGGGALPFRDGSLVRGGTGNREEMEEGEGAEEDRGDAEGQAPGGRNVRPGLENARERDEGALDEEVGEAEEGAADADEEGLFLLFQRQHVVAVRRDVIGRRGEGGHPEDDDAQGKERHRDVPAGDLGRLRHRHGQGQAEEEGGDQQLHRRDPPAFVAEDVDKRAPDGLDDPREVEKAGVERHLGIAHAELLEHHRGDAVHDEIGNAFREIEGRHPNPGGYAASVTHGSVLIRGNRSPVFLYRYGRGRPCWRRRSGRGPRRGPSRSRGG